MAQAVELERNQSGGKPRVDWDYEWIENIDPGDKAPRDTRSEGWFAFAGLAPEVYLLRVVLGVDGSGDPLFVERQVDLSAGSCVLPDEVLTPEDFLTATLERRDS